MSTGSWSTIPTQQVLLAGGQIKFKDLVRKLVGIDIGRFRSEKIVRDAIENYCACLDFVGEDFVQYNRKAKKYAQMSSAVYEREVQGFLHASIPDMKKWELYPHKTRKNSKECYEGFHWKDIPIGESGESHFECDYRVDGKDKCSFSCGFTIGTNFLKEYFDKPFG